MYSSKQQVKYFFTVSSIHRSKKLLQIDFISGYFLFIGNFQEIFLLGLQKFQSNLGIYLLYVKLFNNWSSLGYIPCARDQLLDCIVQARDSSKPMEESEIQSGNRHQYLELFFINKVQNIISKNDLACQEIRPNEEKSREQTDHENRPTGDSNNRIFRHDLKIQCYIKRINPKFSLFQECDIGYRHPSVSLGDWFQDPILDTKKQLDTKIHVCSSPLHKTMQCICI